MKLTLVNCPECHHEFDASQQFEQHEEHFKQMELQLQEQQNQIIEIKMILCPTIEFYDEYKLNINYSVHQL